jgi:hypothetical protein
VSQTTVSAADPYERRRVSILDTDMAYIDTGAGDPIVFLHGNPTSSYLWRNITPIASSIKLVISMPGLIHWLCTAESPSSCMTGRNAILSA